jgi:diguanylate cyclase (GGDEF)-like protein/putative nucleotidyltransferase with HDIG domain
VEIEPLTIVPLFAAVLYGMLLTFVRRRATHSRGVRLFQVMLACLVVSSIVSVAWHSTNDVRLGDLLLRVVTWSDLSVAPIFLGFIATRYPGRSTGIISRGALLVGVGVAFVSVSGAMNRAILIPVEAPGLIDSVAAYGAVLVCLATYFAACGYLIYSFRRERDPFERNRLKYLGLATLLIISGQLTNLVPAFQKLPVDRSLAVLASFLVFFSVIRYRLFDVDLVLKRGIVAVSSTSIVAPVYLAVLFKIGNANGSLMSPTMFAIGLALMAPAAFAARLVRSQIQGSVDRLLLGRHIASEAAAGEFVARARSIRSTRAVAVLVSEVCQGALDSRFASVLLRNEATRCLEVVTVHGPFAALHRPGAIRLDNALLAVMAIAGNPTTPLRQMQIAEGAASADVSEFEFLRDCVLQPITAHGEIIGLIAVGAHVYDGAYSLNDLRLLTTISGQAALAMESARLFEQVQASADTDFLTGLPNHRHLQDLLDQTLARAQSTDESFSVAMVDIDNFKLLNDTHGHIAGDDALKKIGMLLRNALRDEDIVGRYGGDEFLFILPGISPGDSAEILNRIARELRHVGLSTEGSAWSAAERIPLRVTWGVAAFPEHGQTARTLVAAADSELLKRRYTRRRSGSINTNRPSLQRMSEDDPRRVRIASGLLDLLDAKDPYTSEHSQQVASLALLLANELGLPENQRQNLWLGGLLHDVGKLNVAEEILRKPGMLSVSDWTAMHQHPTTGEAMIAGLFGDGALSEIVGSHHERFDGKGYPRGLAGEEIPLLARAISVADAYSAMSHDRPYRKGLTPAMAVEELRNGAGQQWDPQMVETFVRAIGHEQPAGDASVPTLFKAS